MRHHLTWSGSILAPPVPLSSSRNVAGISTADLKKHMGIGQNLLPYFGHPSLTPAILGYLGSQGFAS